MIPNAMMVDRSSDFRCLLMVLDVVFGAKIVKISVLICRNVGKGLIGLFAVHVGFRVHAVGLAIVVDGLALVNCFASLGAGAFESGGYESSHSLCVFWLEIKIVCTYLQSNATPKAVGVWTRLVLVQRNHRHF